MPLDIGSLSAILASALIAYLCGSIPFGLILTKAKGHGDIRNLGSGNIGATNVLRTGNKKLAAATLLCDALKGLLPVLIAQHFGPTEAAAAMIAAPLGHMFPVWLNFKGGKGVATTCGALIAYAWPAALAALATWLIVAILFRYSSLAALIATAMAPVYAWLFGASSGKVLVLVFIALVVIWRHRDNISRLLSGAETKIELSRKPR
jgi:acyl phosphate:glycerol-3-phosphate acyltransferase